MKLNNSLKSLLALALVVGLTACETPVESSPSTHEHTFAEEYSKDETHHWYEATCEHADAVEKVAHEWGEGEVTTQPTEEEKGVRTFTCVCGATKTEEIDVLPHTHKFADEWSKDETHHWKASTCGHAEAETKIEHTYGDPVEKVEGLTGTRTWTCECGYDKVEPITNLVVNYKLPNGEIFDSVTQEVKEGETYSIASPKVRFMAPSLPAVEGPMGAEGVSVDVTYDYSAAALETVVEHGQDMGKLYVDSTKGLSFSYVMKGSTADWDQVFRGETYAIYNGCIRIREAFPAKEFAGDWYDGSNAVNGAGWNALLSSNTEEILVTWSINPDGSVAVYKNGGMVFDFAANTKANGSWTPRDYQNPDGSWVREDIGKTTTDFAAHLLAEVATLGLKVGAFRDETTELVNWSMRDLAVGYAMDDAAAAAYAAQYKSVKGVYVDETKTQIRTPYTSVTKIGSEYSIPAADVPGYTAVSSSATGTATAETSVVEIAYTRNGEEKITEAIVSDQIAAGWGWTNESRWAIATETLKNGNTVTIEYKLESSSYTNNDAAKTAIVIAYDAANRGNRSTNRFDWWGWEDGEFCGDRTNGGMWCPSMDVYHAVQKDCTVRLNATLVNGSLTLDYIITANSGEYAGNVYYMTTYAHGITAENVGIAISPEYAKVTLLSVKY